MHYFILTTVRLFANKVQAELTHVRDTVAWIQSWESSQILSFAGPMYERPYNLALSSERERETQSSGRRNLLKRRRRMKRLMKEMKMLPQMLRI